MSEGKTPDKIEDTAAAASVTDAALPARETVSENGSAGKKITVKRDLRSYFLFFAVMLFVAAVVVCVLFLLPKKNPRTAENTDTGIARTFMFPFVFTNDHGDLYVLKSETDTPTVIDDSAENAVHLSSKGLVIYLRAGQLFEYDISKSRRKTVASGVKDYSMSGDGSMTVYVSDDNSLVCVSGGKTSNLTVPADKTPENFYTVGRSCVVFLKNCDTDSGTADMAKYTVDGGVTVLKTGVSMYFTPGVSSGDKFFYCRSGEMLQILNKSGDVISEVSGGSPVKATRFVSTFESVTEIREFDGSVPITFIFSENAPGTIDGGANKTVERSGVSLHYFNGKTVSEIESNVYRFIYAASDHKLLLYSVLDGEKEQIFRANSSGKVEKITDLAERARSFLFDSDSDLLYYQTREGALYCLNIYNQKGNPVIISAASDSIYKYPNKPFVVFTLSGTGEAYLVDSGNIARQYGMDDEFRLYGADNDKYILLRIHSYSELSLDICDGNYFTRISSNVDYPLFFDSALSQIIYVSDGVMHCWNDGQDKIIGEYGKVSAVDVA